MTNYEVYFGSQERAVDSLTLLVDYRDGHLRDEVNEFIQEVVKTGGGNWLRNECSDLRWHKGLASLDK